MHRHGYQGRKFHRERDQRRALMKSLAEALIINESITTTLPKAKELVPYTEKLITTAKKGTLESRRLVIKRLQTVSSAHKLVDELTPKLKRSSGYLTIEKLSARRGDNAMLARVSFVDDLKEAPVSKPAVKSAAAPKKASSAKTTTTKSPAKKTAVRSKK